MKDLSTLKKKLAAYSAMTTAMIAANQQNANAQIIYHDISPDIYLNVDNIQYLLDMDNDGVYDFRVTYQVIGSNSSGRLDPLNNNEIMCTSSTDVDALSLSQTISANPQGLDYWSFQQKAMFAWGWGPWMNATDKFAAVILHQADGNHFGWIRLTNGKVIKDYAYQAEVNSPIHAGEMGFPTNINTAATPGSFDAFVDANHLIINFQESTLPSQMILMNSVGEQLSEQAITQSQMVVDVSKLAAGIYFVVVNGNEMRQVKKVVIEN